MGPGWDPFGRLGCHRGALLTPSFLGDFRSEKQILSGLSGSGDLGVLESLNLLNTDC